MLPAESRLIPRLVTAVTLAAIAVVFFLHLLTVDRLKLRGPDFDESQYLHVAWEMHDGQRLYRDFVEDHAPFLFLILEQLLPGDGPLAGPDFDPIPFAVRGRVFAALCGLGMAICAGLLAQSISGSWLAALLVAVGIFAPDHLWRDATASIRNDPPTLFLFWLGALLLLRPSRRHGQHNGNAALLRGSLGVGLIFVAALWNPKWPACSLVLGVVHLIRVLRGWSWSPRRIGAAVLPAAVTIAAAVLLIARTVSLRDYWFYTFTFNRLLGDWFAKRPQITGPFFDGGRPFLYCSPAYRGLWPLLAIAVGLLLVGVPTFRRRAGLRASSVAVLIAVGVAAFVEIRFIFPYPNLWPQYYLQWGCALAVLYALCVVGLLRLLPWPAMRPIAQVAVVAIALALHGSSAAARLNQYEGPGSWQFSLYIQQHTVPGQTVWVDARPIAVHSASYYWFAFRDVVAFALEYTARHPADPYLPRITEQDLPICRAAHGLDDRVRFVAGGEYLRDFPETQRCLKQLFDEGRAREVWRDMVYEIRPRSALQRNPPPLTPAPPPPRSAVLPAGSSR